MIKHVEGNLFASLKNETNVVVAHVVNNVNAWGAGFTHAISKNYPEIEKHFRSRSPNCELGDSFYSWMMESKHVIFYHMMAQDGIGMEKRRIRYDKLVHCMEDISMTFGLMGVTTPKIYCPKFGSGLAGGNASFIECLIEDIWVKSMGLDVTIFTL